MAPFTLKQLMQDDWKYKFSRNEAGYPAPWQYELGKVFPFVGRIDGVYGDRNFVCSTPEVSEFFKYEDGKL